MSYEEKNNFVWLIPVLLISLVVLVCVLVFYMGYQSGLVEGVRGCTPEVAGCIKFLVNNT